MQKMINTNLFTLLNDLWNYKATNPAKIRDRKETLTNAEMLYNSRNNVIKAFRDKFFPFKDGFQKEEPGVPDKTLPDWVTVDKKRFNTIKNNVKRVKDKNEFVLSGGSGSRIYVNDSYQLIQGIEHDEITTKRL